VIDSVTQKPIAIKNEFVELLTHPSYVLQIERLKPKRKTRIEKFLSIFDQHCKTDDDYLLEIDDTKLDEFSEIINYLNLATQDEVILRQLEYEEDFEQGYVKLETELEKAKQHEEEAKQREEYAKRKLAIKIKNTVSR